MVKVVACSSPLPQLIAPLWTSVLDVTFRVSGVVTVAVELSVKCCAARVREPLVTAPATSARLAFTTSCPFDVSAACSVDELSIDRCAVSIGSEEDVAVEPMSERFALGASWPTNDHVELASSSVVVRTVLALLAAVPCAANDVLLKSSNTSTWLSRNSVEPVDSA